MVNVIKDSTPKTVAFPQVGVASVNAVAVAKAQVASFEKAALLASNAVDNSNFRLQKATDALKSAEIAYFAAVGSGAWNMEELKKAYNNALAGFRDADRAAEDAAAALQLAKGAVAGIRKTAGLPFEVAKADDSSDLDPDSSDFKGPGFKDDPGHAVAKADDSSDLDPDSSEFEGADFKDDPGHAVKKDDGSSDSSSGDVSSDESSDDDSGDDNGEIMVLCPVCLGDGCNACDGGFLSKGDFADAVNKSFADSSGFDTESLLTLDHQYAQGFQEYMVKMHEAKITKGGPGSGAQPGHPFNGNQWSGGARNFPRLGIREGWKQTVSRYQKTAENAKAAAAAHTALAEGHAHVGRSSSAAAEHAEAGRLHMIAAGAHEGIASVLNRETGSDGGNRAMAAQERAYASRSAAASAAA